jgi:xylose isomerase
MTDFFQGIPQIRYEGPQTDNEFAFRHYNPDEMVMGKSLKEHLRCGLLAFLRMGGGRSLWGTQL